MIPAHWSSLMAEVPESVRRSIVTFSAGMPKRLKPDCLRSVSLSRREVDRSGSTILMRKGSMGGLMSAMRILPSRARPRRERRVSQNVVILRNCRNRASTRSRSSDRKRPIPKSSMANEAMTLP